MIRATLATLAVLVPFAARAQKPPKACVFDTAAHRDTSAVALYLRVHADGDTGTDPMANDALAAALRPRWRPPETIGRMFYPYTAGRPDRGTDSHRDGMIRNPVAPSGEFSFTLGVGGHLRELAVRNTSGDSATDASFIAALEEAEKDGDTAPFGQVAGAVGTTLVAGLFQDTARGGAILIRIHVPRIAIESPASVKSEGLQLPSGHQRVGKNGFAAMRFVIDEAGNVEPASIHAVESSDQLFADRARATLLRAKFNPARAGGCPVKMLVQQDMVFVEVP